MWSSFLEKNVTLFEVLFSAPEPSASGLILDQLGNAQVAFKPITMPLSSEFQVAQKLQLGAERYFEYLVEAREVFFPDMVSKDYLFEIFRALVTTDSDLAKATLGNFEVRLGGQHEFITHQSLVENKKPFEYVLKKSDEFFNPIYFDNISKDNPPKVVIITSSGLQNGSTRYRSIHLADSLQYQGTSSVLIHALTPLDIAEPLIAEAETVIFQRCFEGQGNVGEYLTIAKQYGKRCIAEMDDLVFPKHVLNIGSVKGGEWSEKEAMFVAESYEKLIQQMHECIVSTPLLKKFIEQQYGLNACVVRNKVTPRRLASPRTRKNDSELKLIYASGTYSHKQDFALVEKPLYSFLQAYPAVRLSVLGAAQVSERLLALPNVANYPVLPYTAMLEFISRHDLMLVPLEDDVFNQAKSSVKFVECGAVGVPVLASNIGEFANAIEHGTNGLLASSKTEWEDTLVDIAQRPECLGALAQGAFDTINKKYTTKNIEQEFINRLYK